MFKSMTTLSTISKAVLGLILSIVAATAAAEEYYTIKDGQLERPIGYREWVYVGTPVTPNDLNDGKAAFPEHHKECDVHDAVPAAEDSSLIRGE
jgi:hypothetical protein